MEALIGGEAIKKEVMNEKGTMVDNANNMTVEKPNINSKKVEYDLDIPKKVMKWLNKSARGSIKDNFNYMNIVKKIVEKGFECQINPLDSIAVFLTIQSKKEMMDTIKDVRIKSWFVDLLPWSESSMKKETFVCVLLEEVHL